jgi:hypothetical protein
LFLRNVGKFSPHLLHFGTVIIIIVLITSEISSTKSIFMLFNKFMILVKFDVGRPSPVLPPIFYGIYKNYRKWVLILKILEALQLFVRGSKSDKFMLLTARCFGHEDFTWVRTRSTCDMRAYVFRLCGGDSTPWRCL